MSIDPISLGGALQAGFGPSLAPLDTTPGLAPAEKSALTGTTGTSFASIMANQLQNVQSSQAVADTAAVQAATGDLSDVHDYMIKSNEAQMTTELTVAVRNKAVEAFSEILRMQA
jgi:flagellar hook-basal body complex protein FliE